MLDILYSDENIAVIIKPAGLISEDGGDESVIPLIREALGKTDVFPVHRLDRETGGVMVYALDKKSAAELSAAIQCDKMKKDYLAVVNGQPSEESATLCDLLFKDSKKNKSYVVTRERKGVKKASLEYTVQKTVADRTLVRVRLHTGRSHQIRVQFSHRKMPLVGDRKYGDASGIKALCLFATELSFPHPKSGKKMRFSALPKGEIWDVFM